MTNGVGAVRYIGVVGAGTMGTDVAQVFAEHGYWVTLVDTSATALDRALTRIRQAVRLRPLIRPEESTRDPADVLERIKTSTELGDLGGADYVVENVTESWDVKRALYARLDQVCRAETVFAVNTSAIPITRIGSVTDRPAQVVGTHFMNPASLKTTVEVVRGYHTSERTLTCTISLLASVGRDCVVVNDSVGFVTNRVMMLMVNEAIFLVQERVASTCDIDRLFRECFRHAMGPLETADLIGLDTVLLSLRVLYETLNDPKYRPCPLLCQMVDAGLLGRKSGQGFHSYEPAEVITGDARGDD